MKVIGDVTGLDELYKSIEDEYYETLAEIGREACRNAMRTGTYNNRTWNLRNASGGCIVRNGQVVDIWVENDGSHPDAERNTRNLLLYNEHPYDGLYLANGMEYASFVESRGYEVIKTHGLLYAKRQIKKKIY
jgi:hypothetical protein